MQSRFTRKLARVLAPLGLGFGAAVSHAAAIDVADVVTDIGAQAVPIAAIGSAVLLVFLGIKAFRWVRKAL